VKRRAYKRLLRQVDRLVSSTGWEATARRLDRHPELLGRRTSRLLQVLEDAARRDHDIALAAAYRYHAALLRRCRSVGVAAAIEGEVEAAATVPDLVHSGLASLRAYRINADAADLQQSLASLAEAACLTLPGHPDRPVVLGNLGIGLVDLFEHDPAPRHLRRSVAVLDEALDWSPPGSPEMSAALENLGIALLATTGVDASGHCARRAVEVLAAAVKLAGDATERARRLNNLGVAYSERYRTNHRSRDLDRAVAAHCACLPDSLRERMADGWTPIGEEVARVANLSIGLAERYARGGDADDLDWALDLAEQTLRSTAMTSPQLVPRSVNRALLLRDRFVRDGELSDLEEAVSVLREAVPATPREDPERAGRIDQLATSLRMLAVRRRSAGDLMEAVAIHRQALVNPLAAGERCVVLSNLAASLRALASSSDGPTKEGLLREALGASRSALATGQTSDDRAAMRNNLGTVLLDLYAVGSQPHHLDEALYVLQRGVRATDRRSPERSARMNNLGNARRSRYAKNQDPVEARRARKAYKRGCSGSSSPAQDVLRCAVNWGVWAMQRHAWREAVGALSKAQRATDRLVAQQVGRPDKESWLGDVETISVGLAYCLSELDDVSAAALRLEWGRARVLSEVLERERADLHWLEHGHAHLVDRFTAAAARVRSLEIVSAQPVAPRGAPTREGSVGGLLLHRSDPLGAEVS
jgi:tetratricopeptide (TPR) repeat protein